MSAKLITYVLIRDQAARKVLLVEYTGSGSPNAKRSGLWVPAPELEEQEHPEECVGRVLASLGLEGLKGKLAGVDSFVTRDWHVTFNYVVDVPAGATVAADDRYARAAWFSLTELPEGKAFAHGDWERRLVQALDAAVS